MIQEQEKNKIGNDFNNKNLNTLISPYFKEYPTVESKIKIAILASGNGSNFEYIIKSIHDKKINAEISILIVNNPDCLAIEIAKENNVPFEIINHREYSSRLEHDKVVMNKLEELSVELVVMAGWMRIVGEDLINKFKDRIINIHPSLLPSFKGTDAIQQAIDKKVTITGCTVHYVNKEVDSGSIIIQAAVPINNKESKDDIKKRIQDMEHIILPLAIAMVAQKIKSDFRDKK